MKFSLVKRVAALERKYETIYQRFYANHVRRNKVFKKRTRQIQTSIDKMKKWHGMMNRLGLVFSGIKKGRRLITLPQREYNQLQRILERQQPMKSRRYGPPDKTCPRCGYVWRSRVEKPRWCPKCLTPMVYSEDSRK